MLLRVKKKKWVIAPRPIIEHLKDQQEEQSMCASHRLLREEFGQPGRDVSISQLHLAGAQGKISDNL